MQSQYNIDAIKAGLNGCLPLLQAPALDGIRRAIRVSVDKLDEPMQLAIIGKISSSKSTLINAILGKDELMSTGSKEVSYNVGWLKYGAPDSDIVIHFKDGREPARRSRKEFERLSVDESHSEIDNISYIETFDDSEILRDINVIDTPGLDAKREKDSQNTLDFISKVRPDAVVMLFTHAVAENTLDVVRSFNAGSSFNPLNAIGVLSKIDVLWQETIPRDKSALQIGSKMVANRKKKDPMLSRTLFDLFPVSALLYLASSTVTTDDVAAIRRAMDADSSAFMRSLNTMPKFLAEEANPMSREERETLAGKMGLYGIWLIANKIKGGADPSADDVKRMFMEESGALDLRKTLYNHFGSRAKLIKLESIYQHISQEINKARPRIANGSTEKKLLASLEQRLTDIFSSLVHEHEEYRMLNRLYSGELDLDDDVAAEFRNLCGENGNSAPEMLGLPAGTSTAELLTVAHERERAWRKAVALEPDPEEREWMNVILKSYTNLRQKIAMMTFQYHQARSFLMNQ